MKKIFTLVAASIMALGAYAQDSFMLGMAGSEAVTTTVTAMDGATLEGRQGLKWDVEGVGEVSIIICHATDASKKLSGGNTNDELDAEYGKPIKLSNGAPNLVTLPEGFYTDKIEIFGYCNSDGATSSFNVKETNGDVLCETTGELTYVTRDDFKPMTLEEMPSVVLNLSKAANQFFLTNGGKQPAVYIKIYKAAEGGNDEPTVTPVTPSGNTTFAFTSYKGDYGTVDTDVNLDIENSTLTFNNFLGCGSTVAFTIAPNDPLATPVTGLLYKLTPTEGLSDGSTFDGMINHTVILKNEAGENAYQLSGLSAYLGQGYSYVEITSLTEAKYKIDIAMFAVIDTWDAATSSWVAGRQQFIDFVGNVQLETSAIETIAAGAENAPVEYYNLQGARINEPAAGQIVIRRQGSEVSKILVK